MLFGTLITIAGKDDRKLDASAIEIADSLVAVGATRLKLPAADKLKAGDTIFIRRPCTADWIKILGMDNMGGERHGFTWKPGTRELLWDRVLAAIQRVMAGA